MKNSESYNTMLLNRLLIFIEANIRDTSLNATVICDHLGVSRTVLYVRLRNSTCQTLHEFIKSVRLKRSLLLLQEERLNIGQIAYEVGFSSHSYFDRCFVDYFGFRPKDYSLNKPIVKKEAWN
ncbi:helix-turn-helix transcriptional regulator [Pedobacter cryoconitis]|nr:AraC family transcriptional regulator [Pedobacter cryoconitis]